MAQRRVKSHDADTMAVTATGRGITPGQQAEARVVLTRLFNQGYRKLHHGYCVGGDAQLARIAKDVGFCLIAHPGYPPEHPEETKYRAFTDFNDEVLESRPFILRDKDMVDKAAFLLAAPYQDYMVTRSGTWTTVRYAQNEGVAVGFVYSGRNYPASTLEKRIK